MGDARKPAGLSAPKGTRLPVSTAQTRICRLVITVYAEKAFFCGGKANCKITEERLMHNSSKGSLEGPECSG